ncbi:MAG: monovalent cation/H(+) antiporter subunit G [Acidimicrobiales bacterium]
MRHDAAIGLVIAGTAIIVAASLSALSARGPYTRLHFATVISSLGGPLIAIGLSVANGAGLTTASVLLPTALLFFSGPVLSAAIARALAQREGRAPAESPE